MNPVKLHSFILEDEHGFGPAQILTLAQETALRRADNAGWEVIEVRLISVKNQDQPKKQYLFEIYGFGEILEDFTPETLKN